MLMISDVEYQKVKHRKVEIRKSRINKVNDATYISDVVFTQKSVNLLCCDCVHQGKIYTGWKKSTQVPPMVPVTNMM